MVLLLPGSRRGELRRHWPVLVGAAKRIAAKRKAVFRMVLPDESLVEYVKPLEREIPGLAVQIGRLDEALAEAEVAIAKSGTATLECAFFGVPTVVFYKTSWVNYLAAKQMVKVNHIGMPNLLANEAVYPEFIQGAATAENLARATLELLEDPERRRRVKAKLAEVVAGLGKAGASRRAANAIVRLVD